MASYIRSELRFLVDLSYFCRRQLPVIFQLYIKTIFFS